MFEKEKIKEYLTNFKFYKNYEELVIGFTILVAIFAFSLLYLVTPPREIEESLNFRIEKGETVDEIAYALQEQGIVRSGGFFKTLIILSARDSKIISGDYLFRDEASIFNIIKRLSIGDYGYETVTITIPEGITNAQIGNMLKQRLVNFELEAFLQLAEGKEGYLFPDTYTFLENIQAHKIIEAMEQNFDKKMEEIKDVLAASEYSLEEIIIMASIVEEEATKEARQEVANVLWNRIENDIPLQVDATFVYSIGKNSFTVRRDEILDDTNLYNTYQHLGLPPGPITNPGLASIIASATPQPTDNVFFLTGRDGEMYYGKTFEEHKSNRRRFLD